MINLCNGFSGDNSKKKNSENSENEIKVKMAEIIKIILIVLIALTVMTESKLIRTKGIIFHRKVVNVKINVYVHLSKLASVGLPEIIISDFLCHLQ